jgi:hypothetical protein
LHGIRGKDAPVTGTCQQEDHHGERHEIPGEQGAGGDLRLERGAGRQASAASAWLQ